MAKIVRKYDDHALYRVVREDGYIIQGANQIAAVMYQRMTDDTPFAAPINGFYGNWTDPATGIVYPRFNVLTVVRVPETKYDVSEFNPPVYDAVRIMTTDQCTIYELKSGKVIMVDSYANIKDQALAKCTIFEHGENETLPYVIIDKAAW